MSSTVKSQSGTINVDDLATVLQAVSELSNILNTQVLADKLSGILDRYFSPRTFALFVHIEPEKTFRLINHEQLGIPGLSFVCREQRLWNAIAKGRPFRLSDSAGNSPFADFLEQAKLDPLESAIWVPLVRHEEIVGLITLGARANRGSYTKRDFAILDQIALFGAGSLSTALEYEQLLSEKNKQDKALSNLNLLYTIGRSMTLIDDLKALFSYVLRQVLMITHAEEAAIMLYSKEDARLQVYSVERETDFIQVLLDKLEPENREHSSLIDTEVTQKAFDSGKPVYLDRFREDSSFLLPGESFLKSVACLPLKVSNESLGVIKIINRKKEGGFSSVDKNVLESVADQAALAVNRTRLREEATTDLLTGLLNRRQFLNKADEEKTRARRFEKPFSVMMGDIDKFKHVNDTYGHGVGDTVLIAVSEVFQTHKREIDLAARYGGEEFILLFPESDKVAAYTGAERIRKEIQALDIPNLPRITISMGIASFPEDGEELEVLIKKADDALYKAKEGGRNQVEMYEEESPESIVGKFKSGFFKSKKK